MHYKISEKHIVPGRVLLRRVTHYMATNVGMTASEKVTWEPCMVISYCPSPSRMWKSDSIEATIMWLGELSNRRRKLIEQVHIDPTSERWRLAYEFTMP